MIKTEKIKSLVKTRIDSLGMEDPVEIVKDIKSEHPLTTKDEERALTVAMNLVSTSQIRRAVGEKMNFVSIAEDFVQQFPLYFDRAKLWWSWRLTGGWWEIKDETDVLNSIHEGLQETGITSSAIKSQYMTALQMVARKNEPEILPKTWIQFSDCVVDISRSGQKFQAEPNFFFTNPIPWGITGSDDEETPMIDRYFCDWVGEENKQMLYEICAYSLLPDYPIHRIFCLLGAGRNGKSSFLSLLRKFIGMENVTCVDLDLLGESRFEKSKLFKKLVAEVGETNFNVMENTKTLKSLSGGDLIGGEFKNKPAFDFRNYAKLIISTNTLPMTTDKTYGFYSRWVIIDFPNTFENIKDVVADVPDSEFEALARKSVRVLVDLLKRGTFTNEGDVQERTKKYEEKSNPIRKFIEEKMEPATMEDKVWFWEFKDSFSSYLNENRMRIMSDREIKRKLQDVGVQMDTVYTQKGDGSSTRWVAIFGYQWKVNRDPQQKQHKQHGFPLTSSYMENRMGNDVADVVSVGGSESSQKTGEKRKKCSVCSQEADELVQVPDPYDNFHRLIEVCLKCEKVAGR